MSHPSTTPQEAPHTIPSHQESKASERRSLKSLGLPLGVAGALSAVVMAAAPYDKHRPVEAAPPKAEVSIWESDRDIVELGNKAMNVISGGGLDQLTFHPLVPGKEMTINVQLRTVVNDDMYRRLYEKGGDWATVRFVAHPLPKPGEDEAKLFDTPLDPGNAQLQSGPRAVTWQLKPTAQNETREYAIASEVMVNNPPEVDEVKVATAQRVLGVVKLQTSNGRIMSAEVVDEPNLPVESLIVYWRIGEAHSKETIIPDYKEKF